MLDVLLTLATVLKEWKSDFPQVPIEHLTFEFSEDMEGMSVVDVNTRLPRLPHGMCKPATGQILINSEFWKHSDEWQKRKVIYHEIGHCAVGLGHDVTRPNIMDSNIYTATSLNWPILLERLREKLPNG